MTKNFGSCFPFLSQSQAKKWAQQYQRIEAVLTDALENACGLRMNKMTQDGDNVIKSNEQRVADTSG